MRVIHQETLPCVRSHRACTLAQPFDILVDHGESDFPARGSSAAWSWGLAIFLVIVSGTVSVTIAGRAGGVSLARFSLFRGRGGSSIFPFPLPWAGRGNFGAGAVGSLIVRFLDFGAVDSGTGASSSVGKVFLFESSSADLLARGFFFVASSAKRGIVSANR